MGTLAGLQTLGANVFPRKSPFTHGTGGGLPAGTFVINGIPMTIGGVPMQKAS